MAWQPFPFRPRSMMIATPVAAEERFYGDPLTYQFHEEVRYRRERDAETDWYAAAAASAQRELAEIRQQPNFFRWFQILH